MSTIIIGQAKERDRDRALEIAFEHGITTNGDSPQRVIDRMVRALTGCHPDGRESKEYHDWVWAFTYRGVRWDTGKRVVAEIKERAVLSHRANTDWRSKLQATMTHPSAQEILSLASTERSKEETDEPDVSQKPRHAPQSGPYC